MAKAIEHITQTPDVLAGRAAIRGLRISVAHVVNLVANGMTPAQIVEELPDLDEEDIRQALIYAAAWHRSSCTCFALEACGSWRMPESLPRQSSS